MYIERRGGRIIVAYSSLEEALDKKSCMWCIRYQHDLPCRFYALCRAEKRPDMAPAAFKQAGIATANNRMTKLGGMT